MKGTLAKEKSACEIWILALEPNLKNLMKYINVKNKIITFKEKNPYKSKSSDPQNTAKEEKGGVHPMMCFHV